MELVLVSYGGFRAKLDNLSTVAIDRLGMSAHIAPKCSLRVDRDDLGPAPLGARDRPDFFEIVEREG